MFNDNIVQTERRRLLCGGLICPCPLRWFRTGERVNRSQYLMNSKWHTEFSQRYMKYIVYGCNFTLKTHAKFHMVFLVHRMCLLSNVRLHGFHKISVYVPTSYYLWNHCTSSNKRFSWITLWKFRIRIFYINIKLKYAHV